MGLSLRAASLPFHLSLIGPLDGLAPTEVRLLEEAAIARFNAMPPLQFESLTLFVEPRPHADFLVLEQITLGV